MKPPDPRLLRYSAAARGYLAATVALGLAATALILLQASLLARVLAAAATGTSATVLDRGRVAERGIHAQLIRSGGVYQRLWEARRPS